MEIRHNPLVSVIIPNYNYGKYLKNSIDSVLNQTYKNIELIVVDDGSTDNSIDIALSYGEKLKLIRQVNSGVSAARNIGLANTKGTYVCFLDSDDSWEPEKVDLQIPLFSQQNVGLVYSSINICNKDLKIQSLMNANYKGNCSNYFYKFPIRSIILLGCSTAMVHKEVIERVGGFDVSLNSSADWDFFRRVSEITEVDFVDKPLVNYRRHNASMSASSLEVYYCDNEIAVRKLLSNPTKGKQNLRIYVKSRISWIKFQLAATKALLNEKEFVSAIRRLKKIFNF